MQVSDENINALRAYLQESISDVDVKRKAGKQHHQSPICTMVHSNLLLFYLKHI